MSKKHALKSLVKKATAKPVAKAKAKKAPAKKAATKKAPAKKVATKKVATKKAPAKKVATKKVATKKAPAKKVGTKKVATKKAPAKKVATKKVATKKAPAKKVATKKVATQKAPAKKVATKKVAAKKAPVAKKAAPAVKAPVAPKAAPAPKNESAEVIKAPTLQVGDIAPDFTLQDQNGKEVSLHDFKGKNVVVYFYPKAMTPGCTVQACGLRDAESKLADKNIVVLGISTDPVKKLKQFEEKDKLNFTLLSDPDHKTCVAYGSWDLKKFMGKEFMGILRQSFLIDTEGKVAHVMHKVDTNTHHDDIISFFSNRE